jgi:hypothetical protein
MVNKKIEFKRSDYEYPDLEAGADEIALFLFESSSYILNKFVDFMRTSSNVNLGNYKQFIQKWFSNDIKSKKKAPADIVRLSELCGRFFEVCKHDDEIKKMRGLVPEKLFEKIFEKRHNGKDCSIGYGVKVLINGNAVVYKPLKIFETDEDSDKYRQTVDAGFWDGHSGEFAEIKLQPHAFHTKDINYLRELADKLYSNSISYTIYLVTLDDKDLIRHKLIRLGLIGDEDSHEFILLGKEELFQFAITA